MHMRGVVLWLGDDAIADPFADSQEERRDQTKVHVRVQQRSGRKCITTVQGLADDLDLKRILKAFKKNFRCVSRDVLYTRHGFV